MIFYFGEKVRQNFLNQLINRERKFFTERRFAYFGDYTVKFTL